ncbi:hypothetical protein BC941DRAFT_418502 [Chlamydoabsidia padenii]|nr:hypothetical protein BC941DRAFT_418502 [Chlamydoabsidia padenii]
MATSIQKARRVSFDLEHNTIHVLPTEKQVKEQADKLRREAYQNRTLNQALLDDCIVTEIAASCTCNKQQADGGMCLKSCLKKLEPPTQVMTKRRTSSRRQQNKKQQPLAPTSSRRRAQSSKDEDTRRLIHVF